MLPYRSVKVTAGEHKDKIGRVVSATSFKVRIKVARKVIEVDRSAVGVNKDNDGLRKESIRILRVLAKSANPLKRVQICEKDPNIDLTSCNNHIGPRNTKLSTVKARFPFQDLCSQKLVKCEIYDDNNRDVYYYTITKKGKDALKLIDS